jgi:HprK-related kinase A
VKVGDLQPAQLRARLRGDGLLLRTGPYAFRIRSRLAGVADGIARMYADFPLLDGRGFVDFHVQVDSPWNAHRLFRPQVRFLVDGVTPFLPLPLAQAYPMLEWGLNWCVSAHANDHLIVHAAVIEKGGRAAILPAPPGSGKSTLCAALVQRGWRLLSDELTMIRLADRRVTPLPRPVSLKNQSIAVIRDFEPGVVGNRPVADTIKGTVAHIRPPLDSVRRADETCPVGWIVFPQYEPGAATRLSPLPRSRGFMRVADNAFNYSLLGAAGFEALADVVDAAQCYDFTYSQLDEAIAAFDALAAAEVPA